MRHDLLTDALYSMNNAEKFGKKECTVLASSLIKDVLLVMQKSGYIGSFEFIDDGRQGHFKIQMIGKINKSRVIRPRFSAKHGSFGKFASRYLPARGFGILIVSTQKGVMSQDDADRQGLGGKVLGYVY